MTVDPATEDDLDALWDNGRADLIRKVEEAYGWIEARDRRARRHRVDEVLDPDAVEVGGPGWAIFLYDRGENWLLVWSPVGDDRAKVHYVYRSLP